MQAGFRQYLIRKWDIQSKNTCCCRLLSVFFEKCNRYISALAGYRKEKRRFFMDKKYGKDLTKEYLKMLPSNTTIAVATKRKTIECAAENNMRLKRDRNIVKIIKECICEAMEEYQRFGGHITDKVSKIKKYI